MTSTTSTNTSTTNSTTDWNENCNELISNIETELKKILKENGDSFRSSILVTPIHAIDLSDKVCIKKSRIHKNGLFASQDLKKGELVTFYPCDIVMTFKTKKGKKSVQGCRSGRFEKAYEAVFGDLNNPLHKQSFSHYCANNQYIYELDNETSIIADPVFKKSDNYLGQFINDGARASTNPKSHGIYKTVSSLRTNCELVPLAKLHLAIRTTKDIKKGEELLRTYGVNYWIKYGSQSTTSNNQHVGHGHSHGGHGHSHGYGGHCTGNH